MCAPTVGIGRTEWGREVWPYGNLLVPACRHTQLGKEGTSDDKNTVLGGNSFQLRFPISRYARETDRSLRQMFVTSSNESV